MRIATVVVILALVGTTVGIVAQNGFADGTAYGLMIALHRHRLADHHRAATHWATRSITLRTVAGALCLYLLVGLFFATVYGLLSELARWRASSSRPTRPRRPTSSTSASSP